MRILKAQIRLNELSNKKFSEKDLRGLSKIEKEFIIENNFNVRVGNFFMFIDRNNIDKKQLYALSKKQLINPNGKENGIFNYEKWLTFNCKNWDIFGSEKVFNNLYFERRFCKVPKISFIFL